MDHRQRNLVSEACGYLRIAEAVAGPDTCLREMLQAALDRLDQLIPLGRDSARATFSRAGLPGDAPGEGGERR